jgi:prolyl-tRNA synthetase
MDGCEPPWFVMTQPKSAEQTLKETPPKADDLSEWYTAVCLRGELVSYAPVRGCIVLRPRGFGMWQNLQGELDRRFKETGHENAYFPLLIPESLLMREAAHVEGFAPEVAWVTQGGGEKLTERLAIRPTSEVIIGTMYAEWIQSYRDLPVLINQWANVMRWEKATRPFLRTLEFLWQEGHTAHATQEEAAEEARRMLDVYIDVAENVCAVPVISGAKSKSERFAGAINTMAIEALMPDGKALQAGTSHELGQNFAKAYDITFSAEDQTLKHVWTTSWGVSWRMLGAVIMTHGDDRGLVIPPKLAPVQVVIVPIPKGEDPAVEQAAKAAFDAIKAAGFDVRLDDRRDKKPGFKFADWELRGIPIRVEIGGNDVANGTVTLARRDRRKGEDGARETIPAGETAQRIGPLLDEIQAALLERAREFLTSHTIDAANREEFVTLAKGRAGMIRLPWCDRPECEADIKAQTSATTRVLHPLPQPATCVACGGPASVLAYFAQSY